MGRFNKLLTSLQEDEEIDSIDNLNHADDLIDGEVESIEDSLVQYIERSKIIRDENQVRKYFDADKLYNLAKSIAKDGVLEPLLVYRREGGKEKYQLIFGERRFRASAIAKLKKVPVRIIDKPDSKTILRYQLVENTHHEELNPIEEVEAVLELLSIELEVDTDEVIAFLKKMDNDARRKSNNVIGQHEGDVIISTFESLNIKWRSFVLNQLPVLKLPEDIIDPISCGQIEYTKAIAISKVKDDEHRAQLLQEALDNDLSIRDIRDWVATYNQSNKIEKAPTYKQRFSQISKALPKSGITNDPKKKKKLDSLLKQIEALLA